MQLSKIGKHIVVFEHETVKLGTDKNKNLTTEQLDQFVKFYGDGVPYFKLIRNGIQFNEYVGAIQIGNTLVEVLPKADKRSDKNTKKQWQNVLINMMRAVNGFEVKAPSQSNLSLKNNSVLDLYFEIFTKEVESLVHKGLVKTYRKTEGNLVTLKGSLKFNKQISKNLVHKERFYTEYTTYDTEHILHIILYKTITLLKRINTNSKLLNRINSLLLNFPEMPNQKITEATFERLVFNRKTQSYKNAIDISRLILLQFHPDLNKGKSDVLALMFDMNNLWEKFVLLSLKKSKDFVVKGQNSKGFWKPKSGNTRSIRPDIKIIKGKENFILDTKWKIVNQKPSIEDIRQMYAYHHYFNAEKVALFYPGENKYSSGHFSPIEKSVKQGKQECGLMFSEKKDNIKEWQIAIQKQVEEWME